MSQTKPKTEIACHAKGAFCLFPDVGTIIDIGGQDSKAIRIRKQGRVQNFAMNDKCAAGTGRFLEVMAGALQVPLSKMGDLALKSQEVLTISSICTVFAESEVVSLIAEGVEVREIVSGLNRAIASRIVALVKRISPGVNGLRVAMSGGVARNEAAVGALRRLVEENYGEIEMNISSDSIYTGALGAALFARREWERAGDGAGGAGR